MSKVEIEMKHLIELIHWARRYCDGRMTFAPSEFNKIYDSIIKKYPEIQDKEFKDKALMHDGIYFPYAQDGHYDAEKGIFDARKKNPQCKPA